MWNKNKLDIYFLTMLAEYFWKLEVSLYTMVAIIRLTTTIPMVNVQYCLMFTLV
jgi:hypothetical protein